MVLVWHNVGSIYSNLLHFAHNGSEKLITTQQIITFFSECIIKNIPLVFSFYEITQAFTRLTM